MSKYVHDEWKDFADCTRVIFPINITESKDNIKALYKITDSPPGKKNQL